MPGFILPADLELVAVYGYDAYNRRVIRVVVDDYVGGAWVTTYDGWREAVEHTVVPSSPAQMVPVKQFVHGSDLDEILAYRRFNGTSWEDYHILHGGQDTAAKLVNQSGQVVEQYEYDPFGKATVYTAAGALVDVGPAGTSPEDGTRSAYGLTHLYKAMRLDPETGNCYVRNRFYDPRTGRFLSRDPIGVWGDAGNLGNEYAYAWNRPLVVGDRLGLQGSANPQWPGEAPGWHPPMAPGYVPKRLDSSFPFSFAEGWAMVGPVEKAKGGRMGNPYYLRKVVWHAYNLLDCEEIRIDIRGHRRGSSINNFVAARKIEGLRGVTPVPLDPVNWNEDADPTVPWPPAGIRGSLTVNDGARWFYFGDPCRRFADFDDAYGLYETAQAERSRERKRKKLEFEPDQDGAFWYVDQPSIPYKIGDNIDVHLEFQMMLINKVTGEERKLAEAVVNIKRVGK
jgi:RHS repeat-associated protein